MQPITVGIVGANRITVGPTVVASEMGCFREEGLDVQLVEAGGRRESIPKLMTGDLDVCLAGPTVAHFYRIWRSDAPIALVADQGSLQPGHASHALVARTALLEGGMLESYADLRGKKLGMSGERGDHDWLDFASALRRGGLTYDDVEVVTVGYGEDRHQALADGTIDLTTMGRQRNLDRGREAETFGVWKFDYEVTPGRLTRAVMFSHRFREERPEEARRYVRAYLRGARAYHDAVEHGIDREKVLSLFTDPKDPSGTEHNLVGVNPDGFINAEALQDEISWLRREGFLTQPIPLEQIVVHSYVEDALADLGRYTAPTVGGKRGS